MAFVDCLTPIAIALLAWAIWHDNISPTTAARAQADAWQQTIITK